MLLGLKSFRIVAMRSAGIEANSLAKIEKNLDLFVSISKIALPLSGTPWQANLPFQTST
jgi:hypothetical protein